MGFFDGFFGSFFDFNGDGLTDLSEELMAIAILEDIESEDKREDEDWERG